MVDINEVKRRLEEGESQRSIAKDIGIDHRVLNIVIANSIPVEERKRKCRICGEYIYGKDAYKRRSHPHCQDRDPNKWHQRNKLTDSQKVAFEEYKRRGYNVVWTPRNCPFTFMVNGKRVLVRYSKERTYKYGTLFTWRGPNKTKGYHEEFDIFHGIGYDGEQHYHFIMPAEAVKDCTLIGCVVDPCRDKDTLNVQYKDRWDLLE